MSAESVNGAFTAKNYIGVQGVFAIESGNTTEYMLKNGHGDVTNIIKNGEVTNWLDYDPYGNQIMGNTTNPYRYSGEYFDEESGLIYLRNRYYNPETQRFITEDPIKDGLNWYAYCGNNPLRYVDLNGLSYSEVAEALQTIIDNKSRMMSPGTPEYEYWTAYSNILVAKEKIENSDIYMEDWSGLKAVLSPIVNGDNNSLESLKAAKNSVTTAEDEYNRTNFTDSALFIGGVTLVVAPAIKTGIAYISAGTVKYPGNNPAKSPGKDWEWRGNGDPSSGQGSWYNPKTGESLHPDLNHPAPIGPHWDYSPGSGKGFTHRIMPDGSVVPK